MKNLLPLFAVYLLFRTSGGQLVGVVESAKVPTVDGATAYEVSGGTKPAALGEVVKQLAAVGPDKVAIKGKAVVARREREVIAVTKEQVEEPAGVMLK